MPKYRSNGARRLAQAPNPRNIEGGAARRGSNDPAPLLRPRRSRGTLASMTTSEGVGRIWEVFRQEDEGDPMVHAGNVNAPDEELAVHYAREFYGRRGESHRLWIVAREAITELDDPDLLKPPLDRSHKKPGGYIIKHKLEAAKQRAVSEAGE